MRSPAVLAVFLSVLVGTAVGLVLVCWWCLGPERLRATRRRPGWLRDRLREVGPYLLVLGVVLLANKGLQGYIDTFSHTYGIDATAKIHAIEGDLVLAVQSLFPAATMPYFAAVYVVGYAVLLVAPVVLYLLATRSQPLKLLLTAYAINYTVAVVFYATIVAYGPRNAHRSSDGTSAEAPLLELVPEITYLTALWNSNTNVFPSLHTALSVTVLLLAILTRSEFRRWGALATILAVSIVLATMALGIHWFVDVLAGIVLAIISVAGAKAIVGALSNDREEPPQPGVYNAI